MSSIRPVTQRFPASQEVWHESNLPFACVLVPLAEEPVPVPPVSQQDKKGDGTSQQQQQQQQQSLPVNPPRLTGIAKCLHCGAPHPSRQTHYHPGRSIDTRTSTDTNNGIMNGGSFLLCYLCGRDSSTTIQEQQHARADAEGDFSPVMHQHHFQSTSTSAQPLTLGRTATSTFSLPLRLTSHTKTALPQQVYSVPATTCPVLWFVVLDGSCCQRSYWQAVSRLLIDVVSKDMPPHVHVSILMASTTKSSTSYNNDNTQNDTASETVLAVYQLGSPVPHVLHYTDNSCFVDVGSEENQQTDFVEAVLSSLVPADNTHKSNIVAAARSLMDYSSTCSTGANINTSNGAAANGGQNNTNTTITSSLPLGWTLELIVEALEAAAQPVGQRRQSHDDDGNNSKDAEHKHAPPPLPYAGGRILALLADRPTEVLDSTGTWRRRRQRQQLNPKSVGMGGFGGGIVSEPGQRFSEMTATTTDSSSLRHTDSSVREESALDVEAGGGGVTPRSNGKQVVHQQQQQRQHQRQEESDLTAQHLAQHYRAPADVAVYFSDLGKQCAEVALGVDMLLLVDSSDGDDEDGQDVPDFALPLFSSLADRSGAPGPLLFDLKDPESAGRLERELMARTPWQDRQVFGAELRLRMSPGFGVETEAVESLPNQKGPQLAPLYVQAGLMGPATAVNDSTHLWRMGTCDPFTSFTVDLNLKTRTVQDRFPVDGFGEVAMKPVMQTCFAYTTVVKDADGQYHTVRQMRISSFPVPLARSVEMLYSSLDPEALAVVLFHKLALAAFQDGLKESSVIADNWLQSLLVCAYKSAEAQEIVQREQEEKGIAGDPNFLSNERLLDREGELSAEEVLLAQGHPRLRTIALMTYLLVQCDALRQSRGVYQPSMDLRCAALTQMLSMTPTNLTRCIAPRLQLWAGRRDDDDEYDEKDDCPILDIIDLRTEAVQLAVLEYAESDDLILFLDSPNQLAVMDARYINASASSIADPHLQVSRGLEQTIAEARQSYRTQPSVAYELGQAQTSGEKTFLRLLDALIEDAPSPSGHESFYQWRSSIASLVHEELEKA